MNIEIKCTKEQKEKIENSLKDFNGEIDWNIYKIGHITDQEIDAFGKFTDEQKKVIKKAYAEYPEGFFPNPRCALY